MPPEDACARDYALPLNEVRLARNALQSLGLERSSKSFFCSLDVRCCTWWHGGPPACLCLATKHSTGWPLVPSLFLKTDLNSMTYTILPMMSGSVYHRAVFSLDRSGETPGALLT